VDEEFSKLLVEANGTLDVDKRREIMCQLEQIQMDRGSIGIAYWMNIWTIYRKNIHAIPGHPTYYMLFNEFGSRIGRFLDNKSTRHIYLI